MPGSTRGARKTDRSGRPTHLPSLQNSLLSTLRRTQIAGAPAGIPSLPGPDHSRGWVAGWRMPAAGVADLDFMLRVGQRPGWRAGGGGFHGPLGGPFVIAGWPGWCQGAWGRAVIRVQAAVMASAQGQVAAILSRRRRPPRVSRAAACRIL